MTKQNFTKCISSYIAALEQENRYPTAHVYRNTYRSFSKFIQQNNGGDKDNIKIDIDNTADIDWSVFTRDNLRRYEQYLKAKGNSLNTISTYMRMLRCIYNIGVEKNFTDYIPRLFKEVYTGIDSVKKKALDSEELKQLLTAPATSDKAHKAQTAANLMFQFCGMPFVDLAHLKCENVTDNTLSYNRKKTGTPLKVEIQSTTRKLIAKLSSQGSKFLLPIISGVKQGVEAYKEYQKALRQFNSSLRLLAHEVGVKAKVTSYTIRHSFATSLKNQKVPIEMISEMLGHKSIKTTQTYLKSFSLSELSKINKANIRLFCK